MRVSIDMTHLRYEILPTIVDVIQPIEINGTNKNNLINIDKVRHFDPFKIEGSSTSYNDLLSESSNKSLRTCTATQ